MDRKRERERGKGRGRRGRGGIRGGRMEETREDWRSGSFNWTGSALLLMLQCSVQVLECERSEVYELSLGTWSSFGAVHAPCYRYRRQPA